MAARRQIFTCPPGRRGGPPVRLNFQPPKFGSAQGPPWPWRPLGAGATRAPRGGRAAELSRVWAPGHGGLGGKGCEE